MLFPTGRILAVLHNVFLVLSFKMELLCTIDTPPKSWGEGEYKELFAPYLLQREFLSA